MPLSRGFFFTFEGGEGVGKTTLINRLHDRLKGLNVDVVKTREPGGTPLGDQIRSLLLSTDSEVTKRSELLLFAADRAHHVETLIKPALARGAVVLCDRYVDSSYAYQGVFFDHTVLKGVMDFATDQLLPEQTFYLDLDPKVGFERAHAENRELDRIETRDFSFHEKAREAFNTLAKKYSERFSLIDASQSPENVFDEVWKIMATLCKLEV